jgi:hypothetical protein
MSEKKDQGTALKLNRVIVEDYNFRGSEMRLGKISVHGKTRNHRDNLVCQNHQEVV